MKLKPLPFPSRECYQKGCRKPSNTILKTWRKNWFETDTKHSRYTSQPVPFSILQKLITFLTHVNIYVCLRNSYNRPSCAAFQMPHIDSIRHFKSSRKLHTIPSSSSRNFTIRTYKSRSTNTPTQSWKPDTKFALNDTRRSWIPLTIHRQISCKYILTKTHLRCTNFTVSRDLTCRNLSKNSEHMEISHLQTSNLRSLATLPHVAIRNHYTIIFTGQISHRK